MAARKRKTATAGAAPTAQKFTIAFEDLRSQFKVFGEALQSLEEKFDCRFDEVDHRFEQVDRRFDRVDRQIREMREDIRDLQVAVSRKVDRDEVVALVEQTLARAR